MNYATLAISIAGLLISIWVAATNNRRSDKHDDKQEASELTTLIVKLENISGGINEIKSDMRNMRGDIQDLRDRLIIVEQSTKSAHHRIDTVEQTHKEVKNHD